MRTRIKFCGLVRPGDVDDAVAIGADAVGLVFYPKSPRRLDLAHAASLRRRLPSWVSAVGLFVNAPSATIAETARTVGLDVLQLHGDETPADAAEAGAAAGRPWWKAFRMRPETDLLTSARSFGAAECLVLDAFSDGYGGSGRTFDWSWIPPGLPARIVMSGGLDAGSVADAIGRIRPFAVDVSSGIQGDDPRTKDRSRMERFVAAVLEADARRP